MSFDANRTYNVPDQTAQVARAIFPKGNPVMYLLCLELTDVGFDHTVLSEFRTRLLAHGAEGWLFEGHCQLGRRVACEMRLSRVGERDDDTCLPELRRLPLPG